MANRQAFKSDVSFLEKISMGAVGTRRPAALRAAAVSVPAPPASCDQ
jgi:hypothetical protein